MSRFNRYDNIFDEHDDGADLAVTAEEEAASDDQGARRQRSTSPQPRRSAGAARRTPIIGGCGSGWRRRRWLRGASAG